MPDCMSVGRHHYSKIVETDFNEKFCLNFRHEYLDHLSIKIIPATTGPVAVDLTPNRQIFC